MNEGNALSLIYHSDGTASVAAADTAFAYALSSTATDAAVI